MPLRILLNGARGRMGQAVAAAAPGMGIAIAAATDMGDDLSGPIRSVDAVVDFSSHEATRALLEIAAACGKPVVIGTTGHSPEERSQLIKLAARVPCVWSGNFSIGVSLLFALARKSAHTLGDDYDVEVVEMHHRMKRDAPSGTAARLLEIIMEERKLDRAALRHGREGITGERPKGEVGVHSLRGGDVVGDHTVIFAGSGERIELIHRASDRAVFARGALRAAHWVTTRKPGVYDMQDVLGLA
ncbi:MAG TPA: 4-hydroxy-tetrahydrodipicolinate reductase [Opitutaceae bacterium]|nr:4-hydroxy-tetrahydrodipicolinate reductase [Opitutaceae bacterium]